MCTSVQGCTSAQARLVVQASGTGVQVCTSIQVCTSAQARFVVQASVLKLDLLFLHISLHRWREMSASRDGCQGWR